MTNQTNRLHAGLRRWACGYAADRAAVELLITHHAWLTRLDFCPFMQDLTDTSGEPITVIYWDEVRDALNRGRLTGSSSETAILRIALSLTIGDLVDLGQAMSGLDATNTAAVAQALITAAQHTDRVTLSLAPRQLPDWLREG
ncbi:hypothetical protein AB0I72_23380 [Nocardiopsis sp. NPDC049922]|uniref:hypothetical protein n=1 Tax=Nocardiopsis sp. NPDC049922 TaxID=3155157 RepID=UPI0033F5B433